VEIWVSGVQKGTGEMPSKMPIATPVISLQPLPVCLDRGENKSAALS